MKKLELHNTAQSILEAPALAWSSLAWYWGLSFLGIGPRYMEYMQSGEYELDKAFLDESNDEINSIMGYDKEITIKQRFDRAVNFYEYCYVQGMKTSLNPPWDYPPDLDTLIELRNRMEARSQSPDTIIKASNTNILNDNPRQLDLWEAGGQRQRDDRAKEYANQVKEAMNYIKGEVASRLSFTIEQLDKETSILTQGSFPGFSISIVELMDEVMPQETQANKLGNVYIQPGLDENTLVTEGIIGRYYKAGHNLELAMWNDERKRELSGIHHATVLSWKQLMEIKEEHNT